MGDQGSFIPSGLSRGQEAQLLARAEEASGVDPRVIVRQMRAHLEKARAVRTINPMVNVRLAEALCDAVADIGDFWPRLPDDARYWLAGAMCYFTNTDDDEPDFRSPVGFEDDLEVLNACLRFAGLHERCLRAEDYDDA